ncbi:MAG TPA: DNA primase [Bacteroidales bacterium]|nr:DNA primase [Bacteroidales bacterium]HPT03074.1 DNA primase [Bacteroidales bacterium]
MIPHETIDLIMDAVRIEEVVSDFVSLKRRGSNLIGLCPFHSERTPSFSVSPVKGIYKCFGCGKAGNAVNFMMEHEKFTYPEALRYLAKKYHIDIREEEESAEDIAAKSEREGLFAVSEFAQKFFSGQLTGTDEGKSVGMSYFRSRGFSDDTIAKFQLGYCPDEWDSLTKQALLNGYSREMLDKSGLSIAKEDKLYDRFRSRVIFPIHSQAGRVIGFGGRILSSDKSKAKYVNSPESEIYNKSKVLYGIAFAKNAIAANDMCFLVEGYTDVISMHQAGIQNVVASSGTSLTVDQIKLIKRYTPNITILYDGDPAGIKASFRGIDMILEQGMNVKVVLFPDGEDPDSFARTRRSSEVTEFISSAATDFIRFKIDLLLDETGNDPLKKVHIVKEFINSIALIPDRLTRMAYVKESAERMKMDEAVILNELNKVLRNKFRKEAEMTKEEMEAAIPEPPVIPAEQPSTLDLNSTEFQEREITRLLLAYGFRRIKMYRLAEGQSEPEEVFTSVAEFIVNDLRNDGLELTFENYVKVFREFEKLVDSETEIKPEMMTQHADPAIARCAVDLLASPYELHDWSKRQIHIPLEEDEEVLERAVTSSLLAFKARRIEQLLAETGKEIKDPEPDTDVMSLMRRFKDLKILNAQINKQLGRIVTR